MAPRSNIKVAARPNRRHSRRTSQRSLGRREPVTFRMRLSSVGTGLPVNRSLRIGHEAPCPRAKRSGKSGARSLWDQLTTKVEPTADHEVGPRSDMGVRATGRFMSCGSASQMRRVWELVARLMTGDQSTQEASGFLALSIRGSGFDAPRATDGVKSARVRSGPPTRIDREPDRYDVACLGLHRAVRERLGPQGCTRARPFLTLHLAVA